MDVIFIISAIFLAILFIYFISESSSLKERSNKDSVESTPVQHNNAIPTLEPQNTKDTEYTQLEFYRSLCHKVIDGVYTKEVLASIICCKLGNGIHRQHTNVKWFNARGISTEYPFFIDYSRPIYYAFTTHEEVDAYFNQYINATELERVDIDAEYLAKMNNWKDEQQKIYQAEREYKERKQIAERIKTNQRRRQLEKEVRQELIDSGELFGDKTKRPRIPKEVVDAVWRKDGGRCVYCGSTENIQLDHIIPFSKGGATTVENLQLLCQKCNIEKSNKIG